MFVCGNSKQIAGAQIHAKALVKLDLLKISQKQNKTRQEKLQVAPVAPVTPLVGRSRSMISSKKYARGVTSPLLGRFRSQSNAAVKVRLERSVRKKSSLTLTRTTHMWAKRGLPGKRERFRAESSQCNQALRQRNNHYGKRISPSIASELTRHMPKIVTGQAGPKVPPPPFPGSLRVPPPNGFRIMFHPRTKPFVLGHATWQWTPARK